MRNVHTAKKWPSVQLETKHYCISILLILILILILILNSYYCSFDQKEYKTIRSGLSVVVC